jgi:hypothetical protein
MSPAGHAVTGRIGLRPHPGGPYTPPYGATVPAPTSHIDIELTARGILPALTGKGFQRPPEEATMFGRRSKTQKAKDAVTDVSTNPAVPVAGAVGFTLLGAAMMRRRRRKVSA